MDELAQPPVRCPNCNNPMSAATVKTVIWQDDQLFVVEDIPAQVCGTCMEQFYDENVTDALRRLTEDKFPAEEAKRQALVPFYSLTGRIKTRTAPPDFEHY